MRNSTKQAGYQLQSGWIDRRKERQMWVLLAIVFWSGDIAIPEYSVSELNNFIRSKSESEV
jgi:hypothetical protein